MTFLILLFLLLVFVIIFGVRKKYASTHPKEYFKKTTLITISVSLINGLILGTHHTHGFGIPWWIFSLVNFIIVLFVAVIIYGLMDIKSR